MTTITATGHQRTPLVAALAAGAALVVGGAMGVAWEQNTSTPPSSHAPAYTHPYTRYFYWPAPQTSDALSGSTSGSTGGATTDEEFSGTTHPYPVPRTSGSSHATGTPDGYATSQACRGCRPRP